MDRKHCSTSGSVALAESPKPALFVGTRRHVKTVCPSFAATLQTVAPVKIPPPLHQFLWNSSRPPRSSATTPSDLQRLAGHACRSSGQKHWQILDGALFCQLRMSMPDRTSTGCRTKTGIKEAGAHLATMPLAAWYCSGSLGRKSCAMAYSSGAGSRTPQSSLTTRVKKSYGMATRQPAPSPAVHRWAVDHLQSLLSYTAQPSRQTAARQAMAQQMLDI